MSELARTGEDRQEWDFVIEAGRTEHHYWNDLWRYRQLLWFLAWRDILVRYKQTVFGVAWSVARPLLTMVVFTFVFGRVAKLPSQGVPYPILVYAAMLPWDFFSASFSEASMSLVGNANLISKVYFPRLIMPISKTVVSFVDFAVAFGVYFVLMLYYRIPLTWRLVTLPGFLMLAFLTAIGAAMLVASLNVRYRDFKYVVPFMVQFGLYVSPVGFSSEVIPGHLRFLYSLNPLVGTVDGFRWALLGMGNLYSPAFALSVVVTAVLLVVGAVYFRATERTFADIV